MASSEDDHSDGESIKSDKSTVLLDNNYKCCTKKVCAIQICINCEGIYHGSCVKKKNIKVISGRYIECCDKILEKRKKLNKEEVLELKIEYLSPERKVWLNIYRVNNNVTTEMVEGHIKKQPGFENTKITVTELQTKQGQLKNFCVTAPLTKKNEIPEGSHGGSALYFHKNIKGKTRKQLQKFSKYGEFECAAGEWTTKKRQFIVLSIYRPPNGSIKTFLSAMEKVLEKIHQENKEIIIAGDFNIELLRPNKDASELLNLMESFNLNPVINQDTRVTDRSSSSIDNIFTNISDWESSVFNIHVSDHKAQKLSFLIEIEKNNNLKFCRFYGLQEKKTFLEELFSQSWELVREADTQNVDEQWNIFMSDFTNIFNKNFPKKLSINKKHLSKYRSPEIEEIKKRLDILLIMSNASKQHMDLYRNTKKEYDHALKKQRTKSYEERVIRSDNKSKTMWQICKEISGTIKDQENYQLEGTPEEIAENLNIHFNNTVTDILKNLPTIAINYSHMKYIDKSFYLKPTTPTEVENLGESIKNKFSSGDDEIPIMIVKLALPAVSKIISYIINNSFKYGIFPESLKMALIKPIFKEGHPEILSNYRPISLLPAFSRVFEMLVSARIINFFNEEDLFNHTQHGYLHGRSTQTAIFQFVQYILELLEDKKMALGIFLDISKAYDSLNMEYLLKKLEFYGVRGNANDWLKSYMSYRKQRVTVTKDNITSKSKILTRTIGIDQGSVIGTLLFIIYLNDLGNIIQNSEGNIVNFVDDTNLLTGAEDFEELTRRASHIFNDVEISGIS
ncbi:uncharacterized protein LOC123677854 [Harmonia axyridis]|uniref:uncharacterized protein LOC123677854 n=1 Tax=Harmonia axyridis TaxID=115357 RepID=UPI001E275C03|nr:uncharacterized protein LOC123677854 [Harmonia axyridis]